MQPKSGFDVGVLIVLWLNGLRMWPARSLSVSSLAMRSGSRRLRAPTAPPRPWWRLASRKRSFGRSMAPSRGGWLAILASAPRWAHGLKCGLCCFRAPPGPKTLGQLAANFGSVLGI